VEDDGESRIVGGMREGRRLKLARCGPVAWQPAAPFGNLPPKYLYCKLLQPICTGQNSEKLWYIAMLRYDRFATAGIIIWCALFMRLRSFRSVKHSVGKNKL
jgi:hypothetical protein